jgi:transcriptional regulator with XRE-family HTH domain
MKNRAGEIEIEVTKNRELINRMIAYKLTVAREQSKLTQKELSEKTGIYQADISKLERGIGNPSILTLKRLAEGMGMDLHIEFVTKEE